MNLAPQFGFFELVVVAVIALLVVGPRDLPRLMRAAGKGLAQARRLAAEFQSAFSQMAREAEMEEMRKEIDALKRDNALVDAKRTIDEAVQPIDHLVREETHEIKDAIEKPLAAPVRGGE
jgi:sec-independent protein translocase protein TatB